MHTIGFTRTVSGRKDFTLHTGHFFTGIAAARANYLVFTGLRRTLARLKFWLRHYETPGGGLIF
jgi:hypothetical protein